jgi:hypothetical protein
MKRLIFAGGLSLALAGVAGASQLTGWTNSGTLTATNLVIDATNVVNFGNMSITASANFGQFDFSDVLTYTNRGLMSCTTGFIFNDSPASVGNIGPSINFVNQNPGQVEGGLGGAGTAPRIVISALNITNSGTLEVGQTGEIWAMGNSLDLSRGTVLVQGLDQPNGLSSGTSLGPGEFVQYWGTGINSNDFFLSNLSITNTFPSTSTAPSAYTNNEYQVFTNISFTVNNLLTGSGSNATGVAFTNVVSPSNIITQAIIFADTEGLVNESAFFTPVTTQISTNNVQEAVVEWTVQVTNIVGQTVNNSLFLTDDLGTLASAATEQTNNVSLRGLALLVPTNFNLFPTFTGTSNHGNVAYSTSLFFNGFGTNGNGVGEITNEYSTFSVNLAPVTVQPDPEVAGSTFSNVSGRVEITAGQSLNLTEATINAGNYLNLSSTNHYAGSQLAQVTFPFADISLGSTNGQMSISNLVPPYLTRFDGTIEAWSMAWTNLTTATTTTSTNTNSFTVTNVFTVLMVSSSLNPTSPVSIENLALRSTNVSVSDILDVNASMVISGQNLTITSNAPGAVTPEAELIFEPANENDLYSANLPGMQNFTNFGLFETGNAAFFQTRQDPNNPLAGDGPWQSVVNHGTIASGGGDIFWANSFINTGSVSNPASVQVEGFGPIYVTATTALLTNSSLIASEGDMVLSSGSFTMANETNTASGLLGLSATTLLTDLTPSGSGSFTGVGTSNTWSSGDGFSLNAAPSSPSELFGTTITSSCRATAQCENFWAGIPVALSAVGFTNVLPPMADNVPLGRLILSGGNNNSVFHFEGANYDTVNPYAIYVDQLQLKSGATNIAGGKYTAFNIDTNVTIYFLDATATVGTNTGDISQILSGQAGGHLVWVSNYVGRFSFVSHTYADSQTFDYNRAYVNAFGVPPEPLMLSPQTISLAIGTTNISSTTEAAISWYAPAYSTNTLYYRTMLNTNWTVRTNIVQGAASGRLNFIDSMTTNRLYRVGVTQ